jgi:hypothetical protein
LERFFALPGVGHRLSNIFAAFPWRARAATGRAPRVDPMRDVSAPR